MPLELAIHDILPSLNDSPRFWRGTICEGWSISARPLPHDGKAPEPPYALSRIRQGLLDMVKVELHQDYSWLRLEHVLPAETLVTGSYRLQLSYLADHLGNNQMPQIKIIEYTKAGGQTFAKVVGNLRASNTMQSINVDFSVAASAYPDRSYKLCIEFSKRGSFCFGGLSLIRHQDDPQHANRYVAPYRAYSFQVSRELQHLNDSMDTALRDDPQDWIVRMLNVALRLEDYETAAGLVRYVLKHHGHDKAMMEKAMPRALDTLLALGDLEGVKRLVIDLASIGVHHDLLVQAGRMLGQGPRPVSHGLPSGKLDIFALNRDTEHNCIRLEEMLAQPCPAEVGPLLWANYLRHMSEADYLARLNEYLAHHGSPYQVELGAHADNVLQRVSFRQHRPLAGLMSSGPLVSVIIAAWNAEDTLGYAIRSILNQSYRNIEVLVADDASGDQTAEQMREFCDDPRVRAFRSADNQGPYNIRNQLIAQARGELITFHDADDLALPHRIATQVSAIVAKTAQVSMGSWLRVKPSGHLVAFRDGHFLRICLNSIMFTRAVFDRLGPYRPVLCGADSEFYEQLRGRLPDRDLVRIAQPLVLGLWGSRSLTRTAGIEADEVGYRAPARRAYAGLVGRQRILGRMIIPDAEIERVTAHGGILRTPSALELLNG